MFDSARATIVGGGLSLSPPYARSTYSKYYSIGTATHLVAHPTAADSSDAPKKAIYDFLWIYHRTGCQRKENQTKKETLFFASFFLD